MKKLIRKIALALHLRNRSRCRWFAKPSKAQVLLAVGGSIRRIK